MTAGYQDLLDRLDEIPGIDKKSAQAIVSEIGVTLDEFVCTEALASWAGLCPGNVFLSRCGATEEHLSSAENGYAKEC